MSSVIVAPLTPPAVQIAGVVAMNVTFSPDEALADTVIGESDTFTLGSGPKVTVCEALFNVTGVAFEDTCPW